MFSYPKRLKKRLKYKPGDRVRIVSMWMPGSFYNHEGQMDHWLGKVMTIRELDGIGTYRMCEDKNEYGGEGWFWFPNMIAGLAQPQPISALNIYLVPRKEMPLIPKPATILEKKE